jgi:hypothetical protein
MLVAFVRLLVLLTLLRLAVVAVALDGAIVAFVGETVGVGVALQHAAFVMNASQQGTALPKGPRTAPAVQHVSHGKMGVKQFAGAVANANGHVLVVGAEVLGVALLGAKVVRFVGANVGPRGFEYVAVNAVLPSSSAIPDAVEHAPDGSVRTLVPSEP